MHSIFQSTRPQILPIESLSIESDFTHFIIDSRYQALTINVDEIDVEEEKGLWTRLESLWVMKTNRGLSVIYTFESEAEI